MQLSAFILDFSCMRQLSDGSASRQVELQFRASQRDKSRVNNLNTALLFHFFSILCKPQTTQHHCVYSILSNCFCTDLFQTTQVASGSSRSSATGIFSARTELSFFCVIGFCINLRYVLETLPSTVVITQNLFDNISAAASAHSPGQSQEYQHSREALLWQGH